MRLQSCRAVRSLLLALRCLILAFAASLAGCSGTKDLTTAEDLTHCYEHHFGLLPADVADLKARVVVIGDWGGDWLGFMAPAALVDQIIARGFIVSKREEFLEESGGPNAPPWWTPEADGMIRYYIHRHWPSKFTHSVAVLAHDQQKKTVYFMHSDF